jgi:hypothetical protein
LLLPAGRTCTSRRANLCGATRSAVG